VRAQLNVPRAEVTIAARYPEYKPAPASGITTQEIYTLFGSAVASERGTRRLIGVAAQGMTTSPDTQRLVAAQSRERLAADGFSARQIAEILEAVTLATHNQLGLGTLQLGLPERCETDIDAADLLAIVEDSMSSEIYELMKRSDEGAVVEKAHRRPRFVEDCVDEAIRGALARYGDMPDDAFLSARQANVESIHQHDVVAERFGLFGELRRDEVARFTTMREWLSLDPPMTRG
jgi:GTP cyclohydrolase I/GTP cyclohydrolase-4